MALIRGASERPLPIPSSRLDWPHEYVPVGRAIEGEPNTVYDPGIRSRTVIHVVDIARAFMDSLERLTEQLVVWETGGTSSRSRATRPKSVVAIAEAVQEIAMADVPESAVELMANPLSGETIVAEFAVDTDRTHEESGWQPERDVAAAIERRIDAQVTTSPATERSRSPASE
jgi:nucleoside-diphosphate-sugar epimerase